MINAKAIFSRIGLSFFILMMVQQFVVYILYIAIYIVDPTLMDQGWFIWVISYVPLYLVAFPIFLGVTTTIPNHSPNTSVRMKPSVIQMLKIFPISIAAAYILNMIATALSYLVELIRGTGIENPLESVLTNSNPWVNLLFVVIIAPIMEEIIFRRILYRKLIIFGPKVYVIFSSILFAAFHANLYQFAYAFVLGVIFAMLTHRSGTIRYSIIMHMAVNFSMGGLGSLLQSLDNETILNYYSMFILGVVLLGIILGIRWFLKERKNYVFEPGTVIPPTKREMYLNPGMILFLVLILLLTVTNMIAA